MTTTQQKDSSTVHVSMSRTFQRQGSVLLNPESREFLLKSAPTNLSMNAHLLKAGFMKNQTFGLLKSWKKRYFYLLANCLEFLPENQENGVQPTRVFTFEPGFSLVEMPNENKPLRFNIERPGKATICLKVDDEKEKEEWINAFKTAIRIADSEVLQKHTIKAIEQAISNLQAKLVYGHMKYEGTAFLRETEGKAADSSLKRLKMSYENWLSGLSEENKKDCEVLIKNFDDAIQRGESLVGALWTRIEAQDFIEKYKVEALATELALEKGERELEAAKKYWAGAKKIIEEMKVDPRFSRPNETSDEDKNKSIYVDDIRVFLEDLEENETLETMDKRLNRIGFRRRPSIVNSKMSKVDRSLFSLGQMVKASLTVYRGSTFMTTKRINELKNRFQVYCENLTEFKTLYQNDEDMQEKILKYESFKNEHQRNIDQLTQRQQVHNVFDQINKHSNSAKLAIACRDYASAVNHFENANSLCEELLRIEKEGLTMAPDEMEDEAGDMAIALDDDSPDHIDHTPIYVLDVRFFLESWSSKKDDIEKKLEEINPEKAST